MGESNERPCSVIENRDRSGTDPTLLASDWFLTGPGTLHCIIGLMPGQCHCVWGSGLFSLMYTPSHINGCMYMRVWVCVYLRICAYLCYFFCVCVCIFFVFNASIAHVCICTPVLKSVLGMHMRANQKVCARRVSLACVCRCVRKPYNLTVSHLLVIQMHSVYPFSRLRYEELHAAT